MVLTVIRHLLSYMRAYKPLAAFFFLALLLDLAFLSLAPLSFKVLIDKAIIPQDIDYFVLILLVVGISGLICMSAGVASDYALAKLTARVQKDLRQRLFEHMQHVNIGFFQKTRSSELLSYFSVDLPSIERAMNSILTIGIQSVTVVVISTAVLFYLQWSMAVAILLGAVLIFLGPYLLGRRAQAMNVLHKEQLEIMIGDLQENIKAQKVIKGFNLQHAMTNKFTSRLQTMFLIHYRKNVINAQLERLPMVSLLLVNLTIIGLGSYLALRGHITLGALVAFFTMYTSMGNSVFNLTFTITAFTDVSVSIERMQKLMQAPLEAADGSYMEHLQEQLPEIRFADVSFKYTEDRDVLKKIDLHIPPGSTAAFVGSSGSGKSTLVQLILGFYEPGEGHIEINRHRLETLNRGYFREQIGVVFQENFLFNGTILDNIRISKPEASTEEVIEAAKKAEIHDYITSLPARYETVVLDEGANFSGGQRQRLAIARAILRNPPILLLDEATSALDPISEASINRTFEELSKNRTVVTVTHRLSSITGADSIFVFDQGRLVDSGTHQEMLHNGGYYKELWDKQNGLSVSLSGQEAEIDGERLARLPFFRGIDMDVLKEIKGLFNTETFAAGQPVIHAGEQGEKFYLIARGRVEITKHDPAAEEGKVRLAILEDGDHFGEIALLENIPRTADVTTITPCVFLTLQRKVLYYVLSKYPEIDTRVRQTLKERKN
ncbi:ABC transporter transmembrane domain-containing protein [Paenibacillus eucommiae]|uniref:ATP-binding cassette subfamily B protein n=1 Tax=Paenibacillus eucommiae TaxID=1355755 RepID=A0ABS4ISS5_9BACL|nr:ABC transporter transmembrane domain-containing protein [Paenibacillus eucommiae]MBP1990621.1 ATP-binding cassette subfamily B protein [Paenibacillus eucommiae]